MWRSRGLCHISVADAGSNHDAVVLNDRAGTGNAGATPTLRHSGAWIFGSALYLIAYFTGSFQNSVGQFGQQKPITFPS